MSSPNPFFSNSTYTNGNVSLELSELDAENMEEVAWTAIELLSEAAEINEGAKACMGLFKIMRGSDRTLKELEEDAENGLTPNPFFIQLEMELHKRSKKTEKYLRYRAKKNIGAAFWSWGGALAGEASGIGVDVGTASLGAQALALTGAHAIYMKELRDKYTNPEFRQYVDICLSAKAVKGTSRGMDTAMALIPHASLPAKIGAAVANTVLKMSSKVTLHKMMDRTAYMLHLHAYLEQIDSGAKPATELVQEIFRRRGVLGWFSQYDVDGLINEPAGWMAIADKLKLV